MKTKIIEVSIRDNKEASQEELIGRMVLLMGEISQEQSKRKPDLKKCVEYFSEIADIEKIIDENTKQVTEN